MKNKCKVSALKLGNDFVFGLHNVDELDFADHPIELELGVLFQELLLFVVDSDSFKSLDQVIVGDFVIGLFLKEVVGIKHLFEIVFFEIGGLVFYVFEYFSHALLDIFGLGLDESCHHFLNGLNVIH